ncbi:MAG: isoleucine--tRNA ligase [Candidatus Margulisbacteria bacterium GWF2_35_9]|nr:MAG: isoleucine--tRNA ligase [Candidatus Margulisbacteria bacterium GWF2_35_9]
MEEKSFKDTLNLPKTDMPMKAGLINIEPEILNKWNEMDIYMKRQDQNKGNKSFILHDGPPYPNGNIHLGHALNKILKDIVVKYHLIKGENTPYRPGWDCHGLPIETQLLKSLKKKEVKDDEIDTFRNQCKEYALGFVETQKEQFKQLGIFADYENPYLTLTPEYEKGVIELFGLMAEKGLIYQGKKPIHWCFNCKTALAEAEIEYADDKSPSVYVKFPLVKKWGKYSSVSLIVWTTTPWTLPANVAVAVNASFDYVLIKADGQHYICVEDLLEKLKHKIGFENVEILERIKGESMEGLEYTHPFIDRKSPLILARFVSAEDGSGLVHIAPGHGHDDYVAGLQYKLPIIMPVNESGIFTEEAGKYAGIEVFEANKQIVEDLESAGRLLKMEWVKHSYPHCWRCHKPVIFRATEQWFVSMDNEAKLREKSLSEIKKTTWYPSWGEKRINSMVEGRPDWCISRQRFWGIPIPVFYCVECGEPHFKGEFNKAVVNIVAKEGTNAWFNKDVKDILPASLKCTKCGSSKFEKDKNIMDVWLESGASHHSVLDADKQLKSPADLYLEGSDQHRGWFQSSLLTSVAAFDRAPYKAVLTHGFTIDEKGQKMSKSMGNVIDPLKVINIHGVDILRLWVSSTDFKNDVALSENIIKQVKDAFSKIRNTMRFMVSNLYDFDPKKDVVTSYEDLDKWILSKLNILIDKVDNGYNVYEFHQIYHNIYNFCVIELSSLYMDIQKDNLYCNDASSQKRRSCQSAMWHILKVLNRILCPILSFSMEDVYAYIPGSNKESIFLEMFPDKIKIIQEEEILAKFEKLFLLRDEVNNQLEQMRKDKELGSSLESKVEITHSEFKVSDIENVLVVSEIIVKTGGTKSIKVSKASGEKCCRCWKYDTLSADELCRRCQKVVG